MCPGRQFGCGVEHTTRSNPGLGPTSPKRNAERGLCYIVMAGTNTDLCARHDQWRIKYRTLTVVRIEGNMQAVR